MFRPEIAETSTLVGKCRTHCARTDVVNSRISTAVTISLERVLVSVQHIRSIQIVYSYRLLISELRAQTAQPILIIINRCVYIFKVHFDSRITLHWITKLKPCRNSPPNTIVAVKFNHPTMATSTIKQLQLESLPDYLLIQIFRLLPLADLHSIALQNVRFQQLAISFSAHLTLDVLEFLTANATDDDDRRPSPAQRYESVLNNVGCQIASLRVDMDALQLNGCPPTANASELLRSASHHIGPSLRHLHARNCCLDGCWDDFGELLHDLRSLHLENCRSQTRGTRSRANSAASVGVDADATVAGHRHHHPQLLDFDDTDDEQPDGRALLALRNLELFSLIDCKRTLHAPQITQLIANNRRLKHVHIHHKSPFGSAMLVPTICGSLTDSLQTLSLHYNTTYETDLSALAALPWLRKLRLVNYYVPSSRGRDARDDAIAITVGSQPLELLMEALRDNRTLCELDLHSCRLGGVALAALPTLRALRVLRLRKNYWLTDEDAAMAVGQHGRLRSIDCYDNLKLTDAGVLAMVRGNRTLEVMDVSWVPQLTDAVLEGARVAMLVRSEGSVADDRGDIDVDGVACTTIRLLVNGRNRIDWTKYRQQAIRAELADDGVVVEADPFAALRSGDEALHGEYFDELKYDGQTFARRQNEQCSALDSYGK